MRKFLTAKWKDLLMVNYEVDPALMRRHLPNGIELDFDDGRCFVSLVAFMFLDTRVLGLPIPFHRNFEEVNLRFYVARTDQGEVRKGVSFIKELVPRSAIALVAKGVFGEPYEAARMSHTIEGDNVGYSWRCRGQEYSVSAQRSGHSAIPSDTSHEGFITEHYWGYTRRSDERTAEYKVEHPAWEVSDVVDLEVDVDFEKLYGPEFGHLSAQQPFSAFLAAGSEVSVYFGDYI